MLVQEVNSIKQQSLHYDNIYLKYLILQVEMASDLSKLNLDTKELEGSNCCSDYLLELIYFM